MLSLPKQNRNHPGFTIVELLVVLAIIIVLAAIALPVMSKMRKNANTAETVSNLRQIYLLFSEYETENGSFPPPTDSGQWWSKDALYPVSTEGKIATGWNDLAGTIFTSPAAAKVGGQDNSASPVIANPSNQGFGMNAHLPDGTTDTFSDNRTTRTLLLENRSRTALLMDSNAPRIWGASWFANQFTTFVANRHNGNNTVLFCDGHIEKIAHTRFASGDLLDFNATPGSDASIFWRGF